MKRINWNIFNCAFWIEIVLSYILPLLSITVLNIKLDFRYHFFRFIMGVWE